MKKITFFALILIIITGIAIRIAFLYQIMQLDMFDSPIIDARTYDELAKKILNGDIWLSGPFWQPPMYPYFLALVYKLTNTSYVLVRIIQQILSLICLLLLINFLKNKVNTLSLITACALFYLNRNIIFFETELLNACIISFLYFLSIILFLKFFNQPQKCSIFSGMLIGFSALFRPTILIIVPYLCVELYLFHKKFRYLLYLVLSVILIILPVTIRNYIESLKAGAPELIFISTNAGINFYIGNNPEFPKTQYIRPGYYWQKLVRLPYKDKIKKPGAMSSFFIRQSLKFFFSNPLIFLKNLFIKSIQLLSSYEIPRNKDINFFIENSILKYIKLDFLFLAIFGYAGTIIFLFSNNINYRAISWFIFLYSLTIIFFFVTSRYKIPLYPFLSANTALFLNYLIKNYNSFNIKKKLMLTGLVCFLSLISFSSFFKPKSLNYSRTYYHFGRVAMRKNKLKVAETYFKKALNLSKSDPDIYYLMGNLYEMMAIKEKSIKFLKKAEYFYRQTLKIASNHAQALFNLGNIYLTLNKPSLAVKYFKLSHKSREDYIDPLINLGTFYLRNSSPRQAIYYADKVLKLDPANLQAIRIKSHAYLKLSEFHKALNALLSYKHYLKNDSVLLDIGVIYFRLNNIEKALDYFKKALNKNPGNKKALKNLFVCYIRLKKYNEFSLLFKQKLNLIKKDELLAFSILKLFIKIKNYTYAKKLIEILNKSNNTNIKQYLLNIKEKLYQERK